MIQDKERHLDVDASAAVEDATTVAPSDSLSSTTLPLDAVFDDLYDQVAKVIESSHIGFRNSSPIL